MRKISFVAMMLFSGLTVFGQAVKDRNVIPVAVNLNQVLRMTVTNGGNVEFVFNTIDQYKNGLSAATATTGEFYETDFTVASSTRWKLTYGAETSTFIGTDNPANQLALDNVGFELTESGAHNFDATAVKGTDAAELFSAPTLGGAEVAALEAYPVVLIEDNDQDGVVAGANAGDASDNTFKMSWRCGTKESQGLTTPMNAIALIDQQPTPTPDRYVVNVLFDLSIDE